MKFVYNVLEGIFDLVRDDTEIAEITPVLQFTFNSKFNDFDGGIASNTIINASGQIELAPL